MKRYSAAMIPFISKMVMDEHPSVLQFCFFSFFFEVTNLQEKWRDLFDFMDINNDSVLDNDDVRLSKENYIRLHNLTLQEVFQD